MPEMPIRHPLVLASASPRREALLHLIGLPFLVMSSGVEEETQAGEAVDPGQFVQRAAARKAEAVAKKVKDGVVLGADTVVVIGGRMLGKPRDAEDAAQMLRLLSGATHEVYTGLALVQVADGKRQREVLGQEVTRVTFRALSEQDIAAYVATGEPMDKAGAYAIQGRGAVLVSRIEGCYYNVVGLPLTRLVQMLASMGISVWEWAETRAQEGG